MLLDALERTLERYRLFMLAAEGPLPASRGRDLRDAVRRARDARTPVSGWTTCRCACRWCRRLFATIRAPDVVLLHTSTPRDGKVSLGIEVNVLVAAVEQVRARGGLVVAQLNPRMPYTFGDSELDEDLIDLAIEIEDDLRSPTVGEGHDARRADRRARRGAR